jgi:hypothetical protein
MKFVRSPKQEEIAYYTSDFSGSEYDFQEAPAVELNIKCNYGSDYDGADLTLHLTDLELEEVLDFIKGKLHETTKLFLKNEIKERNDNVGVILYLLDNPD